MSCCDAKRLPHAILESQAGRDLVAMMMPNPMTLPAQAWHKVTVKHPALIVPVGTQAATIYASPGKPGDATSATTLAQTTHNIPRGAILPYPGEWWLYYNTAATLAITVLDGFSDVQLLQFLGTFIGGSGGIADVTDLTNDSKTVKASQGLVVNARALALRNATNEYARTSSDTPTGAEGVVASAVIGEYAQSVTMGRDTSGTAAVRNVEARTASNLDGTSVASLNALLVSSVPYLRDTVGGTHRQHAGLLEIAGATAIASGTLQLRQSGYWGGLRSRRYTLCLPATVTAQSGSSFSATAPVLLFVNPSTNEVILRKLRIQWYDAITIATTRVRFVTDPDNRYSSGGVSGIPTGGFKSTNRDGTAGTAFTPTQWRYNDGITAIVATAADDDEYHYGDITALDTESESVWEPKDDIIIPPSGSLLGYVWDGGGTDFSVQAEIEVANVQ